VWTTSTEDATAGIVPAVPAVSILAIDQGTTGTTALVMGLDGATRGRATREFPQHFPAPGWVEHEPEEIWQSVVTAVREALASASVKGRQIGAIGIANQRETTLLWERDTGRPVHRAIVWQDRRTASDCAQLIAQGQGQRIREATGLVVDPYFAGTKLAWILKQDPARGRRAERGQLAFGTVDSYLVWRLAGGSRHGAHHVTDVTNASRTLLMDLRRRQWHPGLCELLGVPAAVLPRIVPSAAKIAATRGMSELPDGVPVCGMAGDQHAALFGQACFARGDAKCTYGTGAFVLVNTGPTPAASSSGLLQTVGWQIGEEPVYALEGSSFIAGAAVQWLRDGLGLFRQAHEVESLARQVASSEGVIFVPALAGLGAPYWDPDARGLILGLTRGSNRAHLARATLEAIAFQVNDLLLAMTRDLGEPLTRLRVDGGAAANDLLMQIQADVSAAAVERPTELESTARGAAMLAGLGAGLLPNPHEAARMIHIERTFVAAMGDHERQSRLGAWHDAVRRARGMVDTG
jgi:glycerol kinase